MRPRIVFPVLFAAFILIQIVPSDPNERPTVPTTGHARSSAHYQNHAPRFSTLDSIGFGMYVSGVDIRAEVIDGTTYHRLVIDGAFPYGEEGAPAIPVIQKLVAIPESDELSVEVRVMSSTVTQDVNVTPAPRYVPSRTDPGQYDREFVKDDAIYSSDADFPGEYASIQDIGYLRGQRLAWVHIYPVQFNPARREITVATDIDIVVRPARPRGQIARGVGPMTNILRHLAVNYDALGGPSAASGITGGPRASSGTGTVYVCGTASDDWRLAADSVNTIGQPDYLIIMADELAESLVVDLANHRASYNGFNVSIVKMSQIDSSPGIYDTPDSIRLFVKDIYDAKSAAHMADSTLAYVLLMGDAYNPDFDVLIPSSYYFSGGDVATRWAASDAYYSFLTSNDASQDPYPDVLIGRIPADYDSAAWELSNVVSKTINYEPLPVAAWTDSILLVSGRDDDHFSFEGLGATGFDNYFNQIIQQEIPGSQSVVKRHRDGNGPDDDFGRTLTQLVDSVGFRIIGLFDHGFTTGLAGSWFPLHYDSILNDRAYPLVLSIASYTSSFDLEDSLRSSLENPCVFDQSYSGLPCEPGSVNLDPYDVFAERIVLQANGAIGVVGYSRTTDATSAERDFQNIFHVLFQENTATLGELVLGTRILGTTNEARRNLQLLGDPAVNILWQDVAWDSVDLAIGASDIRPASGVKSYAPASNLSISVTVSNITDTHADSVKVVALDNHPDSSSASVLDTEWISSVPAFGSAEITLETGSWSPGPVELWVHVDPDTAFNEPTTINNVVKGSFSVFPYLQGFPKLKPAFGQGVVLIADVNGAYQGKEILAGATCFSAAGDSIWTTIGTARTHRPLLGYPFKDGVLSTPAVQTLDPLFYKIHLLDPSNGTTVTSFDFDALQTGPKFPIGNLNQELLFVDTPAEDSLAVAVVAQNSADDYDLKLIGIDGTARWTIPIGGVQYMKASALSMGDIDSDGSTEVVCGYGMSGKPDSVMVVDGGIRKWTVAVGDAPAEIAISLADLNDDGDLEILANGGFSVSDTSRLYRLDQSSGTEEYSVGFSGAPLRYALGDIDRDEDFDVVVAAGDSLAILNGTLQLQNGRSLGEVLGPMSPPLLADVVGNDDLEIVVLAEAIDSLTQAYSLELQIFSAGLDSVGSWYRFRHYNGADIGHPTIADVNEDGAHDLVFVSADSVLHALSIGTDAGKREWAQPFQNSMQTGLIEQPVDGTYSEPTSLFNRVRITGDATFDSTLYIDATADIAVAATDTLIEVRANGHFTLAGSSLDTVRIYSDPASSDSASWSGILFDNVAGTGIDSMVYFAIRDAEIGIEAQSPILLRDGFVSTTYNTGVYASDSLTLRRVKVSESDGQGLYLGSGVVADIIDSNFDNHTSSGVVCDTCSHQSSFSGGSASENGLHGIHLKSSYAGVTSMAVKNNDYSGIRVIGGSGDISSCSIDGNGTGVYCYAGSEPTIGYCEIRGNTNGVTAAESSYPHLGEGGPSNPTGGHNCFYKTNGTHISVLSDPIEPVYANYNYWGHPQVCCPSAKLYGYIICGNCDTSAQCDAPQGVSPPTDRGDPRLPGSFYLAHPIPNPFNPTTTVKYQVPTPGSRVHIVVYNIRGQRVAKLLNRYMPPGYHAVQWDGVNRSGHQVASGVYFIQMRAPRFVKTVKAVVLK